MYIFHANYSLNPAATLVCTLDMFSYKHKGKEVFLGIQQQQ
jgi:hypothetical protein